MLVGMAMQLEKGIKMIIGLPMFEESTVPSFDDFVGGDRDKMLLFTFKAVRKYLLEMEQFHQVVLTCSFQQLKERNGCPKTILFWYMLVMQHAYGCTTNDDCKSLKVKVRKVWKISTSLLFKSRC